jgi:predicted nucleic acid-binding protein
MVLVDTSVWVEHFRGRVSRFQELLDRGDVMAHPFIIGELACGQLANRHEILELLQELPQAESAAHGEVLQLIDRYKLMGCGLGYVDVHLLASALLSSCRIWTRDSGLIKAASRLGLIYLGPR